MNTSKGASSLFDKYTSLNNAIASTRSGIQEKQKIIGSFESQLEDIQSTCRFDETKISDTANEIQSLKESLAAELVKNSQVHDMERDAKQQLEMLQQMIIDLQKRRVDDRIEFRTKCKEFRSNLKRSRAELNSLDQDDWFQIIKEETKSNILLRNASVQHDQSYEKKVSAFKKLEDAIKRREEVQSRSIRRKTNLEQQKVQLERIRNGVVEMEREIVELNENTKECEEISSGFAKGKSHFQGFFSNETARMF